MYAQDEAGYGWDDNLVASSGAAQTVANQKAGFRLGQRGGLETHHREGEGAGEQPEEDGIEVGGVPFRMLDPDTPAEALREFHAAEGMRCRLSKNLFPEEIYTLIEEEWTERLKANDKAMKLLQSAGAKVKEGSDDPAPRNELRKFVLNPAFWEARLIIREVKDILGPLFERKLTAGAFSAADEESFTLEDKPQEKGGPSRQDNFYKGANLRITQGVAQGHFARITG